MQEKMRDNIFKMFANASDYILATSYKSDYIKCSYLTIAILQKWNHSALTWSAVSINMSASGRNIHGMGTNEKTAEIKRS